MINNEELLMDVIVIIVIFVLYIILYGILSSYGMKFELHPFILIH